MRVFTGWFALLVLGCAALGCSGQDRVTELPEEDATFDVAVDGELPDATTDSETPDTASPTDSGTADTAKVDTGVLVDTGVAVDMGTPDIGTTFSCGTETCGASLQFCRRATSPGICPSIDAGICPAGCPGCPPLTMSCENLPTKCWAKPSCSCILVEVCGSAAAGDCTEKDSGFTVGCRGV